MIDLICLICSRSYQKSAGHYNRAVKIGAPVYCGKACAGIARRDNKPKEQKVAEKAEYDKKYRYYHKEGIKAKKAERFKKDYAKNPEKYKKERQRRYADHLNYLSTPEYKKWKQAYDEMYRAKKNYGEFAESFIIAKKIFDLIDNREVKQINNLHNKSIKRKRSWTRRHKTSLPQLP